MTNNAKKIVLTSDGSLGTEEGNISAGVAVRPVQNAQGGLMTRLKGKQAIAKAELVGAGMQLQMSIDKMKSDPAIQFHGMLDNKGMVQALQTAHLLTDRQIKRDKQGGTVLRFVSPQAERAFCLKPRPTAQTKKPMSPR